jgi:hypothetical protein
MPRDWLEFGVADGTALPWRTNDGTSPGGSKRTFCVLRNGTTSVYPNGGEICMALSYYGKIRALQSAQVPGW